MKRLHGVFVYVLVLVFIVSAQLASAHPRTALREATSVCTDTGLTGPAQQENLLFCANGVNMAGSVYQASIALAQQKHTIVGTPTSVSNVVDWAGIGIAYVTFTSGLHAEHHSDQFVRIYDAYSRQLYP